LKYGEVSASLCWTGKRAKCRPSVMRSGWWSVVAAVAVAVVLWRGVHTYPSPAWSTFFVVFPNQPFSLSTSSPASPPTTNCRFFDRGKSGSMAMACGHEGAPPHQKTAFSSQQKRREGGKRAGQTMAICATRRQAQQTPPKNHLDGPVERQLLQIVCVQRPNANLAVIRATRDVVPVFIDRNIINPRLQPHGRDGSILSRCVQCTVVSLRIVPHTSPQQRHCTTRCAVTYRTREREWEELTWCESKVLHSLPEMVSRTWMFPQSVPSTKNLPATARHVAALSFKISATLQTPTPSHRM
jgi:hypothetical protein